MKPSTKWVHGVKTQKEKKEIHSKILAALPAFKILKRIIEKEKKSGKNYRENKDKYDSSTWPYLQADGIGEERAYNNILKLIDIQLEE